MFDQFKAHLLKFIALNDEEFAAIIPYFEIKKIPKKTNLPLEGQLCNSNWFVLEGCLRKFFINDKGIEQTIEFAIENWWITDNFAYERRLSTEFYIQTVENSVILTIDYHSQEKLLIAFPKMERLF